MCVGERERERKHLFRVKRKPFRFCDKLNPNCQNNDMFLSVMGVNKGKVVALLSNGWALVVTMETLRALK